jgi:hypothetical protein
MLSKLIASSQRTSGIAQRAFRSAPVLAQKPSIGDAVTILESKVSEISQVVSFR